MAYLSELMRMSVRIYILHHLSCQRMFLKYFLLVNYRVRTIMLAY